MTNRPAVPADIERELLLECGHQCAVCGTPIPLERAHIIPWHKTEEHKAKDMICLCANCHERADKEKWGTKMLREYKRRPWVLRRYGDESGTEISEPTATITPTIEELPDFTDMSFRELAEKFKPIMLRHELEWGAEQDTQPVSIEHGQEILARVCQDVLDLRTRIGLKIGNTQFMPALNLDDILEKLKEIQQHQLRMDGFESYKAFWHNGDLIFQAVNDVRIALWNM